MVMLVSSGGARTDRALTTTVLLVRHDPGSLQRAAATARILAHIFSLIVTKRGCAVSCVFFPFIALLVASGLCRRAELFFQCFEPVVDRRSFRQRAELVFERLASLFVGRAQPRVRARVLQLDLILELLEIRREILAANAAQHTRCSVLRLRAFLLRLQHIVPRL